MGGERSDILLGVSCAKWKDPSSKPESVQKDTQQATSTARNSLVFFTIRKGPTSSRHCGEREAAWPCGH